MTNGQFHYNDNKPIWALVAAVIVPDFFFCGHPALYERECHREHFKVLMRTLQSSEN
jgi:hypothetical protein